MKEGHQTQTGTEGNLQMKTLGKVREKSERKPWPNHQSRKERELRNDYDKRKK